MRIQEKLISFAVEKAYPYIKCQPELEAYLSDISFILVGSTATGLCTEESDVDVCLLCGRDTFDAISVGTRWANGRPTEVILDGIQLHYYATSTDSVYQKIREMDDLTLYVYGNALAIHDVHNQYEKVADAIHDPALMEKRYRGAMDILNRRKLAMRYALERDTDSIARAELCVELVRHLLAGIALYDGISYEPRKRMYRTALLGPTGSILKPEIDLLIGLLGRVCRSCDREASDMFSKIFLSCLNRISRPSRPCPESF